MAPPILPKESGLVFARKFKLQPEGLTHGSFFGRSLSISGSWLAVGAPDDRAEGSGSVYLFQRDSSKGWILRQRLTGESAGKATRFGFAVSMNGSHLAVAAPRQAGFEAVNGSVSLFGRTQKGVWMQVGSTLFPPLNLDVARPSLQWIEGRLAVFDTRVPPLASALAIREISKRGNVWQSMPTTGVVRKNAFEEAGAFPPDTGFESAGDSTAIFGSCAVIGRSGQGGGEVVIYQRGQDKIWSSSTVLKPDIEDGADGYGMTCKLDRDILIIGAPNSGSSEDGAGTGAVFVYELAQPIRD
jgi:FG-GAP repeat